MSFTVVTVGGPKKAKLHHPKAPIIYKPELINIALTDGQCQTNSSYSIDCGEKVIKERMSGSDPQ